MIVLATCIVCNCHFMHHAVITQLRSALISAGDAGKLIRMSSTPIWIFLMVLVASDKSKNSGSFKSAAKKRASASVADTLCAMLMLLQQLGHIVWSLCLV